jgi:predicted MFS family arabinose efflux permease
MADDAAATIGGPSWLTYPRLVLGLCSLGWFLVQGGRLIIPALALPIQESLGLSNAGFGVAVTVLWAVYALLQFPGGIASDDLGYRTTLVGSSIVVAAGYLLLGASVGLAVFLLACALIGGGIGLFYITSRTFPSLLYEGNKGRALGIANAAGDIGGVLAPVAGGAIIALALPWRSAFLTIGVAVAVLAVTFHITIQGTYRATVPDVRGTTREAFGQISASGVPLVIVAYSLFALAWQGSVAFIPLYVFEGKGLTIETGNVLLSVFFLMGVLVKPASGWMSDRIGRHGLSIGSLAGAGLTLGVLALFLSDRLAVIFAIALFGATLMVFPPVTQAFLMDAFDDETVGSSFGLTRTVYVLIGSLGPALVGIGSDTIGFDATFGLIALGLLIGALVLAIAVRRTER